MFVGYLYIYIYHKKVGDNPSQATLFSRTEAYLYLRRMRKNCEEKRPVIYLDETWANAHDGKDCAWVDKDDVTGGTIGSVRRHPGKALHLIILGAGE